MTEHIDLAVELAHFTEHEQATTPPSPIKYPEHQWQISYSDVPDRCDQCQSHTPPFTWKATDEQWLCDACRYPPSA